MKFQLFPILLAVVLIVSAAGALSAATITVDAPDGAFIFNGECSISEAIDIINSNFQNSDCIANTTGTIGDNDTIELSNNIIVSSTDVRVPFFDGNGKNGTKSITSTLTIDGKGFKLSRNSQDPCALDGQNLTNEEFRLLHVAANGSLTLKDITIENGCADGSDFQAEGIGDGGAIYNLGELIIEDTTIASNKSLREGGGIYNASDASIDIRNTVFSTNSSAENAGGLSNHGFAVIADSTFSQNSAEAIVSTGGRGGAIYHSEGTISAITGTTFSGNSATNTSGTAEAGALYIQSDLSEISNSTFSGNATSGNGGAISMNPKPGGEQTTSVTTIKNNTFAANTADADGIVTNLGAIIENFYNNLFAEESNTHCISTNSGAVNSSNNLSDGSCPGSSVIGAVTNFDPILKDNGGPTETHALLRGSNAINSGNRSEDICPDRDQRGFFRTDNRCDIGAYEFGSSPTDKSAIIAPIQLLLL